MIQEARDIRSLINELNNATKEYDEGNPYVTDEYWDHLYFELKKLEEETGIIYSDSPTQKIMYDKVDYLSNVMHHYQPMLSLDKTKDEKEIEKFLFKDSKYWDWFAMFKMDGLSCRLTYLYGKLESAETRGNGIEGEDITHNAFVVSNIPKQIPTNEKVIVVDGEIICTYDNFKKFENEYKNPRNFAAGSIRLLNAKECARRELSFIAWDLIKGCEDIDFNFRRLEQLDDWGFETVPRVGDAESVNDAIEALNNIRTGTPGGSYPIDGYVFKFESKKYGESLGRTEHHFKNAIAFKFYDDEYETELLDIEWSIGRTGQLTPVAIFKPVEIDGTIVERASLHNVSIMRETLGFYPELYQPIWVTKVNQIIPQIVRANINDDYHDHVLDNGIITKCPYCGRLTKIIESDSGVLNAYCTYDGCIGKLSNRIDHFCGKKGLDIKGISLATIEKLIDWGWLNGLADVFRLDRYRTEWVAKSGFGEASVGKILDAINHAKSNVQLDAFISAIGVPLVGRTVAKEIVKYYLTWNDFKDAVGTDWTTFEGFGPEISKAINSFDYAEADEIAEMLTFAEEQPTGSQNETAAIKDKVFCITGKLQSFKNRDALKADIESHGGKVVGSMSGKVNYLINNDITSTSSKNKAAKEAGIPIITEDDYIKIISQE